MGMGLLFSLWLHSITDTLTCCSRDSWINGCLKFDWLWNNCQPVNSILKSCCFPTTPLWSGKCINVPYFWRAVDDMLSLQFSKHSATTGFPSVATCTSFWRFVKTKLYRHFRCFFNCNHRWLNGTAFTHVKKCFRLNFPFFFCRQSPLLAARLGVFSDCVVFLSTNVFNFFLPSVISSCLVNSSLNSSKLSDVTIPWLIFHRVFLEFAWRTDRLSLLLAVGSIFKWTSFSLFIPTIGFLPSVAIYKHAQLFFFHLPPFIRQLKTPAIFNGFWWKTTQMLSSRNAITSHSGFIKGSSNQGLKKNDKWSWNKYSFKKPPFRFFVDQIEPQRLSSPKMSTLWALNTALYMPSHELFFWCAFLHYNPSSIHCPLFHSSCWEFLAYRFTKPHY